MKKTIRYVIPVVSLLVLITALFVLFKTDFFKSLANKSQHEKQEQQRVRAMEELEALHLNLETAEKNQNQTEYMNLIRQIIAKEKQLDALWAVGQSALEVTSSAQEDSGAKDFFTREQKIQILADGHGLDSAVVSEIKDELEIMFEYEYVEKFARS